MNIKYSHFGLKDGDLSPLPYKFDLLSYDDNENSDIKEQIDNFGKVIYQKAC